MTWLPDSTLHHLRAVAEQPDLDGTGYEIIEKIARGGMGTVYRVKDRELDREVAIKVLSDPQPSPEEIARMMKEARILARLEHPGIVPIHDVGTLPDGRAFYAMKLVRGSRLDRHLELNMPLPELLRIFGRICESVAFAHASGVIHRDLKPANIMVGPFGEVLVMDWGVAKYRGAVASEGAGDGPDVSDDADGAADQRASSAAADTSPGTVLGTPGYMSPEQARGELERVDERSDVYALGAILDFMLTREVPDRYRAAVPRALEAICRKALAREPAERYQDVDELAADVARFLAQSAVAAYREGPFDRLRRLAWKYRTPLLLILAYLMMRILLIIFAGT